MVITTGGKLKITKQKAMDKKYTLMEEPTMVNIIIMNKMVMQFTRVRNFVITDNGKILNFMGTAMRKEVIIQSSLVSGWKARNWVEICTNEARKKIKNKFIKTKVKKNHRSQAKKFINEYLYNQFLKVKCSKEKFVKSVYKLYSPSKLMTQMFIYLSYFLLIWSNLT